MSLGALINQKKNQSDISTVSWSKFEIKFIVRNTIGNEPKNRTSLNKSIYDGPSVNLRPLFNSNLTKVYVIKWSQN